MPTPIRILSLVILWLVSVNVQAATYYVATTGSDTRSSTQAQNSSTPWRSIQVAIDAADNGDIIEIASGTYTGFIRVRKSVTLQKQAGALTNPIITATSNPTSPVNIPYVIGIRERDVVLRNLDIHVPGTGNVTIGIMGDSLQSGAAPNPSNVRISGLQILNCNIYSTKVGANAVQSNGPTDAAINLRGGLWSNNSRSQVDTVTIKGCSVRPLNTNSSLFNRGIWLEGPSGVIGGSTIADENTIITFNRSIQIGTVRNGIIQILNNTLNGYLEFNNPRPFISSAATATSVIAGNTITAPIGGASTLIDIKNLDLPDCGVRINNNILNDFNGYGIFSGGSQNVAITNNEFNPLSTSTISVCIGLNTGYYVGAGLNPPIANGISASITGNVFNANPTNRTVGIEIGNGKAGAAVEFDNIAIGGSGSSANTFSSGFFRVIRYLTAAQNNALAQTPINLLSNVVAGDVSLDIDARGNNFATTSTSSILPISMQLNQRYALEDLIDHGVDYDRSGFVLFYRFSAYITDSSRTASEGNAPSLNRVSRLIADGFTIYSKVSNFNESVTLRNDVTINAPGLNVTDFIVNGVGKTVTLNSDLRVSDSLGLINGIIQTGSQIVAVGTGRQIGGSATSFVWLTGIGSLKLQTTGTAQTVFHVGSVNGYSPIGLTDANGSNDSVSVNVLAANSGANFTPSLPGGYTQFVKQQWTLDEGTVGGGNYSLQFNWLASNQTTTFSGATQGAVGKVVNDIWVDNSQVITGTSTALGSQTTLGVFAVYTTARVSGVRYYVDAILGSDARTLTQARNIATPWLTLSNALSLAGDFDTITLHGGASNSTFREYVGHFVVNKRLTIEAYSSDATYKPILKAPAVLAQQYIMRLDSSDITLRGLRFIVALSNAPLYRLTTGVLVDSVLGSKANNIVIEDNEILGDGTELFYFKMSGMDIQPKTLGLITIRRNKVGPLAVFVGGSTIPSGVFGTGIILRGMYGFIGGNSLSDSNRIAAFQGVKWGDAAGGRVVIKNNSFLGQGLEINAPKSSVSDILISNNRFNAFGLNTLLYSVIFRNNTQGLNGNGVPIFINGNDFTNHYFYGVWSTRSNNIVITNNTFRPSSNSNRYKHIYVNTKQTTASNQNSQTEFNNGVTVQGNNFFSNGLTPAAGVGIELANYDNRSIIDPSLVVIGGAGALANSFNTGIKEYVKLNSLIGNSSDDSIYNRNDGSATVVATRPTAAVKGTFDLSGNKFDVGSGLQLPSQMSLSNLFALEEKIIHGIDQDSLGLVSVVPNTLFITPTSYTNPTEFGRQWPNNLTNNVALLRRAFALSTDGDTIKTSNLTFASTSDNSIIRSNVWLKSLNNGLVTSYALTANGTNKVLSLGTDLRLTNALDLNQANGGKINTRSSALRIASTATVSGGSSSSYVITAGNGRMIRENVGNSLVRFPIGTAANYAPATFQDANITSDSITARVFATTTAASFAPPITAALTNWAKFQWNISEGTVGGSNAQVTFTWPTAETSSGPITASNLSIAKNSNSAWSFANATLSGTTATGSGYTSFGPFAVVQSTQPLVTVSTIDTNLCAGDPIKVKIFTSLTLNAPNTYTVQLSSATGSFTTPTVLGTVVNTGNDSLITIIPLGIPAGTGYQVRAIASNNGAPITGDTYFPTITINVRPNRPVVSSNNGNSLCTGDVIRLSGTTVGATTYEWTNKRFPGVVIATTDTLRVIDSATYVLRVGSGGCLSDTAQFRVIRLSKTATPTVNPAGPVAICLGSTTVLSAPSNTGRTYKWSNGQTTPTITVGTAGSYKVSVKDPGLCASDSSIAVTVTVNPLPTRPVIAVANGRDTNGICSTDSIILSGPVSATSWIWSTGATTQNITVRTASAISLQVTNAAGCTSAVSRVTNVRVNPTPSRPTITSNNGNAICVGDTIILTGPAGGGITAYEWKKTSGAAVIATTRTLRVLDSATYVLRVAAGTCFSDTARFTIIRAPRTAPVSVTPAGPVSICTGGTTTLTAPGAAGRTYKWSNGATTQAITVGTSRAGGYKVSVKDPGLCASDSSVAVIVNVLPIPNRPVIFLTRGDTTNGICVGDSVILSGPVGATGYVWSTGATTPNVTVRNNAAISLQVISAAGCTSAVSRVANITVNPIPATPAITTSTGSFAICDGSTLVLRAPRGFSRYLWTGPTGPFLAGDTAEVNAPGGYSLRVVSSSGCTSQVSLTATLTVNTPPTIPTITASALIVCAGQTVQLSAPTGFTYTWSNGATSQVITVSASGTFTVVVRDANGCSSPVSAETQITVGSALGVPVISSNPTNGVICNGNTATLSGQPGFSGYIWSTGETTPSIIVNATGSYTLKVINSAGCTSSVSLPFVVTRLAPLDPKISTSIPRRGADSSVTLCAPGNGIDSVRLTASNVTGTVTWGTGETSQSIVVAVAGGYFYTLVDANGCTGTSETVPVKIADPIIINITSSPVIEPTTKTIVVSRGESASITANVTGVGNYTYQWDCIGGLGCGIADPTLATAVVNTENTNIYNVTVTDPITGCTQFVDSIKVIVADGVYIPNYFSPNGDGENEVFRVRYVGAVKEISLQVFNKFGGLVWETSNVAEALGTGWDGNEKNSVSNKLPADTYLWTLKGKTGNGRDLTTFEGKNSGQVTLGR